MGGEVALCLFTSTLILLIIFLFCLCQQIIITMPSETFYGTILALNRLTTQFGKSYLKIKIAIQLGYSVKIEVLNIFNLNLVSGLKTFDRVQVEVGYFMFSMLILKFRTRIANTPFHVSL